MSSAWLFLGDLAYRAAELPCQIPSGDRVLLGPPQSMFRPSCKWNGEKGMLVEVLGQETLDQDDLDEALEIVKKTIRSISTSSDAYTMEPSWLFRASYLVIGLRENALARVALKKWLLRTKPNRVIIVREHRLLTCIDFVDPLSNGPDNVVSFVAEELCREFFIPYDVVHCSSIKKRISRYIYCFIKPRLVSYLRLLYFALRIIKHKYINPLCTPPAGGVLFFSRSQAHTNLFSEMIDSCPRNLRPKLVVHKPLNSPRISVPLNIPISYLEKFGGLSCLVSAFIFHSPPSRIHDPEDNLVSGFMREYIRHINIYASIVEPYYKCVLQALLSLRPSLIIASDEPGPFNLLMYNAAKFNNIPTVSIQHGELSAAEIFGMHLPMSGDLHLVRPIGIIDYLRNQHFDVENFFAFSFEVMIKNAGVQTFRVTSKNILIAGTGLGIHEFIPVLTEVANQLLQSDEKLELYFRPHPSESVEDYDKILKSRNINIKLLPSSVSILDQKMEFVCAIVFCSSIALDTVLLGIPTIIYNFNRWPLLSQLHDSFVITHSYKEIVSCALAYLNDPAVRSKFYANREKLVAEYVLGLKSPEHDNWWPYLMRTFRV